jgi:hypothetical protein
MEENDIAHVRIPSQFCHYTRDFGSLVVDEVRKREYLVDSFVSLPL